MKNKLIFAGIAMGLLVGAAPAFAAPAILLQHGGVGQKAGDAANFGVAICDNGSQAVSGNVPFQVTANGKTVNATVNGPLSAGGCQYTYLAYGSFGMTAGNTYSVIVSIDPNNTVAGASMDAPATYSMTVPSAGKVLGANITAGQRSQWLAQLANMVAILQGLLAKLIGR